LHLLLQRNLPANHWNNSRERHEWMSFSMQSVLENHLPVQICEGIVTSIQNLLEKKEE
jgi:hypothetical protein